MGEKIYGTGLVEKGFKILLACLVCGLIMLSDSCFVGQVYVEPLKIPTIRGDSVLSVCLTRFSDKKNIKISINGNFEIKCHERVLKGKNLESNIELSGQNLILGGFSFDSSPVKVFSSGSRIVLDGTPYYGSIVIHFPERFLIVNEVSLEKYLEGVIVREMSYSWPKEALKAQTVAARSYALYETRSQRVRKVELLFDLYDDERSQVYVPKDSDKAVYDLVEETRGLVVVHDDDLVYTLYCSTCGGHTEPAWEALDVYPKSQALSGVVCNFCKESKYYHWQAKFSMKDVHKKLFPDAKNAKIRSISITKKSKGGHALEILVKTGIEIKIHANLEFRRRLGPSQLKSTLFDSIIINGDWLEVKGRGWGHAAGMCQTGAKKMATDGWDFKRILQYYYPGGVVRRLNGSF